MFSASDSSDDDGYGFDNYGDYFINGYEDFDDISFAYSDESYGEMDSKSFDEYSPEKNRNERFVKFFEKMNTDRRDGTSCDGLIRVEGKEFPVHKLVLKFYSPYFHAMFAGSFDESKQKFIELKDVKKDAFEVVLNYIYGETSGITSENLPSVYDCADMLCVDCVLKECGDFLEHNWFGLNNKIVAYQLAKRMELKDTVENLMAYFQREFITKVSQESYFAEMPYCVLQEIIDARFSGSISNDSAVQAIVLWLSHQSKSQFAVVEKLVSQITLDQVSNATLDSVLTVTRNIVCESRESELLRDALIDRIQAESDAMRRKISDFGLRLTCIWTNRLLVEVMEFNRKCWDWTKHVTEIGLNKGNIYWEMGLGLSDGKMQKPKFMTEQLQAVAKLKNEVFFFGNRTVLGYNTETKVTRELAAFPKERYKFRVVTYENSMIAVGGTAQNVLKYDSCSNSWLKMSNWYTTKCYCGVVIHRGIMYMVGGSSSKGTSGSTYFLCYDFTSKRYTRLTDLLNSVHNPLPVAFDYFLYIFGREEKGAFVALEDSTKSVSLCQIYNITKEVWSISSASISANETVVEAKIVNEGILLVIRHEELTNKKLVVALYKPGQDCIERIGCLPALEESELITNKFFLPD